MSLARFILGCFLVTVTPAFAQSTPALSTGQLLYLPIYSYIWHGDVDGKGQPLKSLVSVLVSVRNTDPSRSIRLTSAQYYATDGKKLNDYVRAPALIKPMGTYEIFVPKSDVTGGSGANFVIAWRADVPANPPVVEAIHVDLTVVGRSYAFTTSARQINGD